MVASRSLEANKMQRSQLIWLTKRVNLFHKKSTGFNWWKRVDLRKYPNWHDAPRNKWNHKSLSDKKDVPSTKGVHIVNRSRWMQMNHNRSFCHAIVCEVVAIGPNDMFFRCPWCAEMGNGILKYILCLHFRIPSCDTAVWFTGTIPSLGNTSIKKSKWARMSQAKCPYCLSGWSDNHQGIFKREMPNRSWKFHPAVISHGSFQMKENRNR